MHLMSAILKQIDSSFNRDQGHLYFIEAGLRKSTTVFTMIRNTITL